MPDLARPHRLAERSAPAGRVVLRQDRGDGAHFVVMSGYQGPELPATVTGPQFTGGSGGRWELRCREGSFEFQARSLQQVEERPSLYEPLHRRFALSGTDRLAVRVLLALLRMPGGARLLRLWHSRRA